LTAALTTGIPTSPIKSGPTPAKFPATALIDDGNGYVDDVRGWNFVGTSYTDPATGQ